MAVNEKCVLCGTSAAVRVRGTSFCSSCGVSQYSADTTSPVTLHRRTKRAALFAVFSSGILVKTLLGAVALAAVGGVAATTVLGSDDPPDAPAIVAASIGPTTSTTTTTTGTTALPAVAPTANPEASSPVDVAAVADYATAIQLWAECVSTAASAHSGGAFDPQAACGPHPNATDFGITVNPSDDDGPGNSEDAPGHDDDGPGNSENTPGQTKDKKTDA